MLDDSQHTLLSTLDFCLFVPALFAEDTLMDGFMAHKDVWFDDRLFVSRPCVSSGLSIAAQQEGVVYLTYLIRRTYIILTVSAWPSPQYI